MKRWIFAIVSGLLLLSCSWAQNPNAAAQQSSPSSQASAPTQPARQAVIPVELTKSLDSKKLKQGDPVSAKTAVELRKGDGSVIPRGSTVKAHITQAMARSKGDPESALGIQFDSIALKNGQEIPLKASIQAVGPLRRLMCLQPCRMKTRRRLPAGSRARWEEIPIPWAARLVPIFPTLLLEPNPAPRRKINRALPC